MARFVTLLSAVFLFLTASAVAADKLDAPPSDLTPTTVRLSAILQSHKVSSNEHVIEDWAYTDTGASGTEHLERSGANYHSKITLGDLVTQYGQVNGQRWHQDANGMTFNTTSDEDQSFVGVRVNEDAADPKNDVTVLGETAGANPAYVLEIHLANHVHPEWVYYDAKTGEITRVERIEGKHRVITTYDDFRTVDGVTQAWHFHDAYYDPTLDDDWKITAFHANALLPEAAFSEPPSVSRSTGAPSTVTPLDAQITEDGAVIVRLNIGGKGRDFELDSSSPTSYIDWGLQHELQLPTFGQSTHLSDGSALSYQTELPDAQLGPVVLHKFAVTATDITYNPSDSTRVVGVLGYDFLASNIIHVDYINGRVWIIPSATFSPNALAKDAVNLPLNIDGGIPMISMTIAGEQTKNVILNDDYPRTMVFGSFTQTHADQFKDVGTHSSHSIEVPFADDQSYGKQVDAWLATTNSLVIDNANFGGLPIVATNYSPEYGGGTIDAMLGYDALRYYDLYFDFPDGHLYIVPNKLFHDNFHPVKQ